MARGVWLCELSIYLHLQTSVNNMTYESGRLLEFLLLESFNSETSLPRVVVQSQNALFQVLPFESVFFAFNARVDGCRNLLLF